jgi:uncharacterized membrane protein YoaK (UPF0700 family)
VNLSSAESAAIEAQTAKSTEAALAIGAPIAIVVVGVILAFAMRRKDLDEKFRVLPLVICVAVALIIFIAHSIGAGTGSNG